MLIAPEPLVSDIGEGRWESFLYLRDRAPDRFEINGEAFIAKALRVCEYHRGSGGSWS